MVRMRAIVFFYRFASGGVFEFFFGGERKCRNLIITIFYLQVNHIGDALGVLICTRRIDKKLFHLAGWPHRIITIHESRTIGVIELSSCCDGRGHILHFRIVQSEIVAIIGADIFVIAIFCNTQKCVINLWLHRAIGVFLEFEEKIFSKNTAIIFDSLDDDIVGFSHDNELSELSVHRAGEGDEVLRILLEQFEIDARSPVVISFHLRARYELDEIAIASDVFCQEDNLIDIVVLVAALASFSRYEKFYSHDGLDSFLTTCLIEFECAVHIPCIGDSDGFLSEFLGALCESFWVSECLLKSVVRMCVEMYE